MCGSVSLIGRAGGGHGLPEERKFAYRSVSHSRASPEEGRVCQHEGVVPSMDCKERGMSCRGVERGEAGRAKGWEYRER